MSAKIKWLIAILVILSVVLVAQATALQSIYLPLLYNEQPTATPTRTSTPTATPTIPPTSTTECLSGKDDGICITDVDYKPTTSQLDEFVSIKNLGSSSVDLDSWRLKSERGYLFVIDGEFTLPVGATVKVWTGFGTNSSTNIYMNRDTEFWKDNADCAYLKDDSESSPKTIDKICWQEGHFFVPTLWGNPE